MASLDFVLTIVFGMASLLGLVGAVFCFVRALKVANKRDGDIKMFLWAVGTMACLIVAGMSAAYILLPIVFTYAR